LLGAAPKDAKDKRTDALNVLGADGWELVAIEPPTPITGSFGQPGQPTYVFKRAKGQ
jgi:hypothetical protein